MALVVAAGAIRRRFWGHQRQPASPHDRIRQTLSPAGSSIQRMGIPLRFITMSPGNTAGTEALRDLPTPIRIIAQRVLTPYVARPFRLAHSLEDGGRRLVGALTDASLRSGRRILVGAVPHA